MSDDEKLLNLLEAHGQEFFQSFDLSGVVKSSKRKAGVATEYISPKRARRAHEESSSEEEWGGIQSEGPTTSSESGKFGTRDPDVLYFLITLQILNMMMMDLQQAI